MSDFLILGPNENKNYLSSTGGIIVLFSDYIRWLKLKNIKNEIIDTNKSNYYNKPFAFLQIVLKLLLKIPFKKSISLHGTANDFIYIAPILVFYSKIWKKKIILRKFAGNFDTIYHNLHPFKKLVLNYTLKKSDVLFFETKGLVKFGKKFNVNSHWLPNVRPASSLNKLEKNHPYSRSFVYISQISVEKGILDLVSVFKNLNTSFKLDIYGPLIDINKELLSNHNIKYLGFLNNHMVNQTLIDYDCLILPSYREGYPGIIIEAMSVGVPVIATKIGGIPEIIKDQVEGDLFKPGDKNGLKKAIMNLTLEKRNFYSQNCLKKFEEFDSERVYPKVIDSLI